MNGTKWFNAGPQREELQRALTVATAGSVLVQNMINKVIQSLTLRYQGVWSTLKHVQGSGSAEIIDRRAPGTTSGQWVDDTTEPDEDVGVYTQATFTFRTALSRSKVTRKLQATGRSFADALAKELLERLEDHVDVLESAAVTGDNAANAQQISGLLTLIGSVAGQVVANTTTNVGGPLVLAKLDEAIDKVKGNDSEKIIFASLKGRRLLNAALQAQQQFNDRTEIDAGFRVRTYDDIAIVATTGLPDTLVWNGTAARITAFTGGTTSALIIVNRNMVYFSDLTPTTAMPLARTTSQNEQFDIFTDTVLVYSNTLGGSILGGLNG